MFDLSLSTTNEPNTNWTKEQLKIINSTEKHVLVEALAGTGKSSTLMGLAHKHKNGLYLAFNKNIVNEIVEKLPDGWSCSTFHAFGLNLIKKNQKRTTINFFKYSRKGQRFEAAQLAVNHLNMNGNDTDESWIETCKRFHVGYNAINDARYILREGRSETEVISAEDMLQYPIMNGWKSEEYDILLIDEVQDMSPQQVQFLIKCVPAKRIVFVGDRFQSIYYFRGSDTRVFDKIKEKYNPKTLPLTQSFRCPKAVIKEANKYVGDIWSDIGGGLVTTVRSMKYNEYPEDCFILCRVNSGLVSLANEMIRSKVDFSIGGNFVKTIKREINAAVTGCNSIEEAIEKSKKRLKHALKAYKKNNWSTTSIENRYETIRVVFDNYTTFAKIKDFVNKLEAHTVGSSNRRLLTGHACKGLENKNVFILNRNICNKFALKAKSPEEMQEEFNILYVMITRSLENLTYVDV